MEQEILGSWRMGLMTVSTIGRLIFWDYFQHVKQRAESGCVSIDVMFQLYNSSTEEGIERCPMMPKSKRLAASDSFYLFLVCLYENFFLVGENSPSLCPTISSVIVTSLYIFPLCT